MQWIQTEWSKRSRGAPGATVRNATPRGLELPELGTPLAPLPGQPHARVATDARWLPPTADTVPQQGSRPAPFPVHLVTCQEHSGFCPVEELTVESSLRLLLVPDGDDGPPLLRIMPGGPVSVGLRLRRGESGRLVSDWGTGPGSCCGDEWRYGLDVVNVYYGPYHRDVFLVEPTRLRENLSFPL